MHSICIIMTKMSNKVEGGGCKYVQIDEEDRLAHLAGGDCCI